MLRVCKAVIKAKGGYFEESKILNRHRMYLFVVGCILCCLFHCVTSERQQLYDPLAPVKTRWAGLGYQKKLEKISEFEFLRLCIDNLI